MNKISVLKVGASGDAVAELHAALRALVAHDLLYPGDAVAKAKMISALRVEFEKQTLGAITEQVLDQYRKERGLGAVDGVDVPTANLLNIELMALGLLTEKIITPVLTLDVQVEIRCIVSDSRGAALAGIDVEPLHEPLNKARKAIAKPQTSNDQGAVTFRFSQSSYAELTGAGVLNLCFVVRRGDHVLGHVLPKDDGNDGVLQNYQASGNPIRIQINKPCVVHGRVQQANGLPGGRLSITAQHIGFGAKKIDLQSSGVTDASGRYVLAYDRLDGKSVNLQVVVADSAGKALQTSLTIYGAKPLETIDLQVTAVLLEAEYKRLSADLLPHLDNQMANLRHAREDADQKDLTALNRLTGWDARLLALAAQAENLNQAGPALPSEGLYGLLRAGLPSDPELLSQISPKVVQAALEGTAQAGLVGLDAAAIKAFIENFQQFSSTTRLAMKVPGGASSYTELLAAAGLSIAENTTFTKIFWSHAGQPGDIWKTAHEKGIKPDTISKLKLHGKLSHLVGHSAALVQHLLNLDVAGVKISDPSQLVMAGFHAPTAWQQALTEAARAVGKNVGDLIPPAYASEKPDAASVIYCEDLARKLRMSYPTEVTVELMRQKEISIGSTESENTGTYQLLKKASSLGFKLGRQSVNRFLKDKKDDLQADTASAAHLKTLHRLYQITPNDKSLGVMAKLGLKSATEVIRWDEKHFIKRYIAAAGNMPAAESDGRRIYARARQVHGLVLNAVVSMQRAQSDLPVHALSKVAQQQSKSIRLQSDVITQLPTMEVLLGSMDYCECEHCRSVLSPAAYLVDLLQFLEVPEDADVNNPYKTLTSRRPDLPHIPLTCDNTNIALPYIDLVNEILEYCVAKDGALDAHAAHSTEDITTPDLVAEPQELQSEVSKTAYQELAKAKYPLSLPFDLWIETVRQFSNFCETPLAQLLEVLRPAAPGQPEVLYGGANGAAYGYHEIWIESLGLTPGEAALYADTDPLSHWHELYGFTDLQQAEQALALPVDPKQEPRTDLNSAKVLSRCLGVTYKEFVDLVQTKFVSLDLEEPDIGCNFDHVTVKPVAGLSDLKFCLLKLNLFVRLWRKLGWSIDEIDQALKVFIPRSSPYESSHLSKQPLKTALIYLAHLKTLDQKYPLGRHSILKWLTLWSELTEKDGNINAGKVIDARALKLGAALVEQALPIQGTVGLTWAEIAEISVNEKWILSNDTQTATQLTAATLTVLYRYSLLAKALKTSVSDLLKLKEISNLDPFASLSAEPLEKLVDDSPYMQTLAFIELVEEVKESGFSIEDINFLLLHRFDPIGKYHQDDAVMLTQLKTLGEGLRSIEKEKAAINAQPDALGHAKPADGYWLDKAREFVLQTMAAQTGADAALLQILLCEDVVLKADDGQPLWITLQAGGENAVTDQPIDESTRTALTRLAKTLQLAHELKLSGEELLYFSRHAAQFDDFDIGKWPVASAPGTPSALDFKHFAQFRRLASYARLKSSMTAGAATLTTVFAHAPELLGAANDAARQEILTDRIGKLTRRSPTVVAEAFKVLFGENPAIFPDETSLWRLWQILQLAERFGVAPAALQSWTRVVVVSDDDADKRQLIARNVRESIRARFDAIDWRRVAQSINDPLRQQRRDALVAFCLHKFGYARVEQLYEHLLIDPGMEPVVQTSRIRLAISSVQLFIQRILLNLEKELQPSVINSQHWEWMKRYRVWEANRKIFLFPENWLEPEFRDDKTHLFKELEGALLQGDVSDDLAEDAFFNYLKKLDELARLEIVAMHIEDKENEVHRRILHVFGRTFNLPHKYFYRRFEHQMWSPWEPVSAEIEGDHLAPVIWRDRLYLFWVTFMERASESQASNAKIDPKDKFSSKPKTDVDAYLHWSAYQNGEWSTAEASGIGKESPVRRTKLTSKFDPKLISVHVTVDSDQGGVSVHLTGHGFNDTFLLAGRNAVPENGRFIRSVSSLELYLWKTYTLICVDLNGKSVSNGNVVICNKTDYTTDYTLVCDNKGIDDQSSTYLRSLQAPFFFQDRFNTFFIQPDVREAFVLEVTGSLPPPSLFEMPAWMKNPDWWRDYIQQNIPDSYPGGVDAPVVRETTVRDWAVTPEVLVSFHGSLIGRGGLQAPDVMSSGLKVSPNIITGAGMFNTIAR